MKSKITPCLWFDGRAEEAAKFYVSVFRNAKMGEVTRYGETGPGAKGSVMTASFTIEGPGVRRPEWWAQFQVQRGGVLPGPVRDAGGGRPLLGQAHRRWEGRGLRLGEGQVRPFVADRADRASQALEGRRRSGGEGDEGDARHEE